MSAGQAQTLQVFELNFITTGERGFSWKTLVSEYYGSKTLVKRINRGKLFRRVWEFQDFLDSHFASFRR
jgi:hypothetical protein